EGRALRPRSIGRWLDGHHPDPMSGVSHGWSLAQPFRSCAPRAPVPPLSKPESKSPQLSGDFWDTTLAFYGLGYWMAEDFYSRLFLDVAPEAKFRFNIINRYAAGFLA